MKQQLVVLGSTGSIGKNTLDVVSRHPDLFDVFALTGGKQVDLMLQQCLQFKPGFAVMADEASADVLANQLAHAGAATKVLKGAQALIDMAAHPQVDSVMAAIVGAAGLAPCIAAARAGKRLMLANKEALVVGGEVFMKAVEQGKALLLPIDSEHSAVFQALPENPGHWAERVQKIILTASGGPFRNRDPKSLRFVTVEEACAHPNWVMGRKISVDSATMMNKALEVIEAHFLFRMPAERIEVVIHPQSIVHSMVQYKDQSVVAQLGTPDMRVPIAYGLGWPGRIEAGASALDFRNLSAMTFESIDDPMHQQRFPGLQLAWHALRAPAGTTAVLNAANEVAVAAFLDKRIRFDQIHDLNIGTLEAYLPERPQELEDLLEIDQQARRFANHLLEKGLQ